MPVVVFVDRLPVIHHDRLAARRVGGGMDHQVKVLADVADAGEGATQQSGQVIQIVALERSAFERRFMRARQNPSFIRHARRIGTVRDVVAARLNHARLLLLFLGDDVAQNAALLLREIIAGGPQFVEHATGNEGGGSKL